ncbi:MAG: hypothetical protein JEZ06_15415 [Anaerolineaceae bacterium]|nr:hypothetical protein [Anaerolineaceae bacterium]
MTNQHTEINELGKFRQTYLPRSAPGKVMLGVAIFSVLMAIIELIIGISKSLKAPSSILSDKFRQDSIFIAFMLVGIFILIAIVLGFLYYQHIKYRIHLYEQGLIVTTWRGDKVVLWENLSKVEGMPIYGQSRQPRTWEYKLTSTDGDTVHLRGIDGIRMLGQYVERKSGV